MSDKDQILARHANLPQTHTTGWSRGSAVLQRPAVEPVVLPPQADLPKVIEASERTHELSVDEANGNATSQPVDPIAALQQAEYQLDLARVHARECRSTVAEARANFARCLAGWNATQPIQTVEGLKKEWIRSNQEDRRLRAEARQLQRPATVSETARAMSGGNMRRSPAAYRRGAFTRAEARTIEVNKMAAARMNGNIAPRTKLPSER
jgi:hypothetical protein